MQPVKRKSSLPKGVTWDEIEKQTLEGKFDYLLEMVDPSIFKLILDEKDSSKSLKRIQKMLIQNTPEHATEKHAQKVLTWMKMYARIILNKK